MKKKRKMVYGEYDREGYEVFLNGGLIYSAGNSPQASDVWVPIEDGLSLRKIRSACLRTTRAMAQERGAELGGVSRMDPGVSLRDLN